MFQPVDTGLIEKVSPFRINPIPGCNCDMGRSCKVRADPEDPETYGSSFSTEAYSYDTGLTVSGQTCGTGLQFYPLPFPYGDNQQIWDRRTGPGADDWIIVDSVRAPAEAGEYVLRWRCVAAEQQPPLAPSRLRPQRVLCSCRAPVSTGPDRAWVALSSLAQVGHGAKPTDLDELCGHHRRVGCPAEGPL